MKRTKLSTTLVIVGFGILLLVIALSMASCAPVAEPTGPILGPPAPTATQMPIATEAPTTCTTEGYEHLPSGETLVAEIEGQELAKLSYAYGILTITSGSQQNSTPLPEGTHYMTFVLVDGETAIAQADMEVKICDGEFYYRPIIITPYQSQDA